MMRKSLLISPYFPPVGVSGTKRALHLSRNLVDFGWRPVVLTGAAIKESYDGTLLECIPSEVRVSYGFSGTLRPWLAGVTLPADHETPPSPPSSSSQNRRPKSSSPSLFSRIWRRLKPKNLQYWLPFDRYWLDTRAGIRAARQLIKEEGIEVIHVSADPWAPLISALRLSREFSLPLVVDFRDPWSTHEGKMALRPALTRWWIRRFEAKLFAQASAIILNTETARDVYIERYAGRISSERFYAVRNAFDLGLFYENLSTQGVKSGSASLKSDVTVEDASLDSSVTSPSQKFTALYFGRFRAFVSPDLLFEGFSRFVKQRQLAPHEAQLKLIGELSEDHQSVAQHFGITEYLEIRSAIPFREGLPVLQDASVLLLVIEPDCYMQIPGKLYDYFAAARPIIALSANDEANRMISDVDMGVAVDHHNLEGLVEAFDTLYENWLNASHHQQESQHHAVAPYSAHEQARQVSAIYEAICAHTIK